MKKESPVALFLTFFHCGNTIWKVTTVLEILNKTEVEAWFFYFWEMLRKNWVYFFFHRDKSKIIEDLFKIVTESYKDKIG